MKRFLFLALFSAQVFAAQPQAFSFQFKEIRFPDLLRVVYSEVLDRSYVLDTEPLNNEDLLTVHIKDKTAIEVNAYIDALLDARGFAVQRRGAVDIITKKPKDVEPEKEVFVYRPRFRSVQYLQDLVIALLPKGSFSGQRMISNGVGVGQTSAQTAIPGATGAQNQTGNTQTAQQWRGVPDTGTSAYSQIDKAQQDTLVFWARRKMCASSMRS